ncbi:alpha/beta hydrolase family protein [Aeropyrum pernix]|nr:S9 family peptidase [Aeropyrum pernix]
MEMLVRRFLAVKSSHTPRIDPSTGCIYYLSDSASSQPVIWKSCESRNDVWLPWERRVGSLEIAPDGLVAFSTDKDGDERWSIYIAGEDLGVKLVAGEDGSINMIGPWSPDGRLLAFTSNKRNGVDFDLYVFDREKGSVSMVVEGEGIIAASSWIDGSRLLAVKRNSNLDSDILAVNVYKGEAKVLTRHRGEELNTSPRPIGGGKALFISNMDSEFTGIALIDLQTGDRKLVFREQWDVEALEVSGKTVVYSLNVDGESRVYTAKIDERGFLLQTRSIEGLPRGSLLSSDLNEKLGLAVFSLSTPKHGIEIYIAGLGRSASRLTVSPKAWLREDEFVEPEHFSYESFDGIKIRALLYKPDKPLYTPPPAVVYLHGGPESQERVRFNVFPQALAAIGIATIAPNYRGSTGYGREFVHLDDVEKRMDAVRDVYYAVKAAVEAGLVDGSKLCVMGGSYGGYLTLMSLAIYPDLWKCGVEIVGIVNLVTFIRNTSPYRRRYRIAEYGDPDVHGEIMLKLSPITYVENMKAPLMVIHGAKDPRVPVSEAEQLVEALSSRGVRVRYVRLEDEGHGIVKLENKLRVYREALEFIYENLASR